MNSLDRVVLKEIVAPFFGSVLLFTSLFMAAGELQRLIEFAGKAVPTGQLVLLVLYTLPSVLSFTIPMAMLLATLLGFGRLSGDSEVVALFAAGSSFGRVMRPVLLFSLAISLPIVVLNQSLIPAATQQREKIINDVREKGSTAASTTQRFSLTTDSQGQTLAVTALGGVDFGPGGEAVLKNVSIAIFQAGTNVATVRAPRAVWKLGTRVWRLESAGRPRDVSIAYFDPMPGSDYGTVLFGDAVKIREFTLGSREELKSLRGRVTERSTSELLSRASVRRSEGKLGEAREAEIEAASRSAFPIAAVVFALVGGPLGVQRTRSGKGLGFGLSVLITFSYWTITSVCKGSPLPAVVACQLPNAIGVALGVYLIWRVSDRGAVN